MKTKLFILLLSGCFFFSCNKDDNSPDEQNNGGLFREGAGVTDRDGNVYKTVIINLSSSGAKSATEQEWMAENLKATKYADGTDILLQGREYCNDDPTTVSTLGYLYNWNAAMKNSTVAGSQGACPTGWHIPTIDEYNTLITGLGGAGVAGKKMKSTETAYWTDVTNADNTSGFTARGTGWDLNGMSFFYKEGTMFWTSTEDGANARLVQLNKDGAGVVNQYGGTKAGKNSVRCIKD